MTKSSQQLQAIPTEYKGVRFRSKSEAVFARSLDLYCDGLPLPDHSFWGWSYEPFVWSHCRTLDPGAPAQHNWDFGLWLLKPKPAYFYGLGGGPVYHKTPLLIEYKPSKPTRTYSQELRRKWQDWKMGARVECRAAIIYGSPWESAGYRMNPLDELDDCTGLDTDLSDLLISLNRYGEEAKKYRFDLDPQFF